ncbi:unnamed protein product [Clonostachys solani]|uniref:Wax synthase domain-containing protein n=1 Tax=Clonostachys solani TaxID=160281 RepID=A0A9N9YXQ9_9HYPO|nr:unnamed protein product [Clonostachys solani]
MALDMSSGSLSWLVPFFFGQAVFLWLFVLLLLGTTAQATTKRVLGLVVLGAVTYFQEYLIVQICLARNRPLWAGTAGSLLWVQLLSASDLLLALRVDSSQLPPGQTSSTHAAGLLWSMRRIGTRWQVKTAAAASQQSRAGFVFSRAATTLGVYLFVDFLVSMPPPDPSLIQISKATLFSLHELHTEDVIFRVSMTIAYWVSTGVLVLFMNNLGAIVVVLLNISQPEDCIPLFGSFLDAFTVRRFWGVTWHQMFRSFLTGHADLVVDNFLPFLPRHSLISRYTRLAIAFFISGAIHYRADQLMGVPNNENGAIIFFMLHALVIMAEDTIAPVVSAVLPLSIRRILGLFWVLIFFVWSTPIWSYANTRVGNDAASLLPVRLIGPWAAQYLNAT